MNTDSFSLDQFVHQLARTDAAAAAHPAQHGLQRVPEAEFCLVLLRGDISQTPFHLLPGSHTDLGRHTNNHLIVRDPTCSRNHCRLTCVNGTWFVEDLRSRNGTLVNGTRIDGSQLLCNGDEIQLGRTRLRFTEVPVTDQQEEGSAGDQA